MDDVLKAKVILEKLDNVMNINYNNEKLYLNAIVLALKLIDKQEHDNGENKED